MRILFIEPFYGGSHKQWLDQWSKESKHNFILYTLPARHWKWRMEASAVFFAKKYKGENPDVDIIICSDFLNLPLFTSLAQIDPSMPLAVYFHENQLSYPWSGNDLDRSNQRDRHYAFINYTTALRSNKNIFNSHYNKTSFLEALPEFLSAFPDKRGLENIEKITENSLVLPLGFSFPKVQEDQKYMKGDVPVILWNHRWEYDKAPDVFFHVITRLKDAGVEFKLIICGEKRKKYPLVFDEAKKHFSEEIIHFGFAESRSDYLSLLEMADIQFVTAIQDFFGISIVEAMFSNVYPIVPNRLAYPEHFPDHIKHVHLYDTIGDGINMLKEACLNLKKIRKENEYRKWILNYSWNNLIGPYDNMVEKIILESRDQ